jgi:hypothetical protein
MTRSSFRAASRPCAKRGFARLRRGATSAAVLVVALLIPACLVREARPYALYPNPEQARPSPEVVRLAGPIGSVDGRDVSRLGESFALLPGCHEVKLAHKVADVNTVNPTGYVATLPPDVTYALNMQAGHTYEFEVHVRGNAGPTTTDAYASGRDRDAQGHGTAIPEPAPNAPPQSCAAAAP